MEHPIENPAADDVESVITDCSAKNYERLEEISRWFRSGVLDKTKYLHLGNVDELLNVWEEKKRKQQAGEE